MTLSDARNASKSILRMTMFRPNRLPKSLPSRIASSTAAQRTPQYAAACMMLNAPCSGAKLAFGVWSCCALFLISYGFCAWLFRKTKAIIHMSYDKRKVFNDRDE
jgi:hypothetical protein